MNNLQKLNLKKNLFNIIIFENVQICFWSVQGQNIFFLFLLIFSFLKKSKNIWLETCIFLLIFWGPATKEKGNIETWNFWIGVQQQFGTT